MTPCDNCGQPIIRHVAWSLDGTKIHHWMHVIDGGLYADCRLSATPPRTPRDFSDSERADFQGRLENAADAIVVSIVEARK